MDNSNMTTTTTTTNAGVVRRQHEQEEEEEQHQETKKKTEDMSLMVSAADGERESLISCFKSNLATTTMKKTTTTTTVRKEDVEELEEEEKEKRKERRMMTLVDDAVTFLKRPSFLESELGEVGSIIRSALDRTIRMIEGGGKDSYECYVRESAASARAAKDESQRRQEEERRQAHDAAIIVGSPRIYQSALFEMAKKRNTIVNLGTGKGKTLIALLCIDHFSYEFASGKKQTLFMVPSVPLALQQTTTLQANLPYVIQTACINVSNSEPVRNDLARSNVIVATHGAVHDLLMHYGDMFSMERFNLVVLDECHYASRSHPYKVIMDKFYHTLPPERRPRILGLTASPLSHVKHTHTDEQIATMLSDLETTLDAKVACLRGILPSPTTTSPPSSPEGAANPHGIDRSSYLHNEHRHNNTNQNVARNSASSYSCGGSDLLHKPAEEKLVYYRAAELPADFPSSHEEHGDGNDHDAPSSSSSLPSSSSDLHPARIRELKQLHYLYQDLGPLPVALYCRTLRNEVSRNVYEDESSSQFDAVVKHLDRIADFCHREAAASSSASSSSSNHNCGGNDDTGGGGFSSILCGRSEKLLKLERILEDRIEGIGSSSSSAATAASSSVEGSGGGDHESVGLIFVERRITAMAIQNYLQYRQDAIDRGEWIRASDCIDHRHHHHHIGGSGATFSHSSSSSLSSSSLMTTTTATTTTSAFNNSSSSSVGEKHQVIHDDDDEEASGLPSVHPDQFDDPEDDDLSGYLDFSILSPHVHPDNYGMAQGRSAEPKLSIKNDTHHGRFKPIDEHDQFADADDDTLVSAMTSTNIPVTAPFDASSHDDGQTHDDDDEGEGADGGMSAEKAEEEAIRSPVPSSDQFCDAENDDDDDEFHITLMRTAAMAVGDGHCDDDDEKRRNKNGGSRRDKIRCGVLVRQATQIFKYLSAPHGRRNILNSEKKRESARRHQEMKIRSILNSLRRKEINLLIATSVVEEGVDVQACSFVVAFDRLRSTKAYVQMKGRARKRDAKFFVFQDQQKWITGKERQLSLAKAQIAERRVHDFLESRYDADSGHPLVLDTRCRSGTFTRCPDELRAVELGEYRAPHGVVDLKSAKSLLNKYALHMPLEASARACKETFLLHMPIYEEMQLILPSHLPHALRTVSLPDQYHVATTAERHQMLALMACVRLHWLQLLSDRLLPFTQEELGAKMLEVAQEQMTPIVKRPAQISAFFREGRKTVHVYPILVAGEGLSRLHPAVHAEPASVVLVSTKEIHARIPEVEYAHPVVGPLHYRLGSGWAQELSHEEWNVCSKFFAQLINERWRRKKKHECFRPSPEDRNYRTMLPYVLGCSKRDGVLDIGYVRQIVEEGDRNEEQRTAACRNYDVENFGPSRLCSPTYRTSKAFLIHGPSGMDCSAKFPDEKVAVETFQDYFKVRWDLEIPESSPLLIARQMIDIPVSPKTSREKQALQHNDADTNDDDSRVFGDQKNLDIGSLDGSDGVKTIYFPLHAIMELPFADARLVFLCAWLPQFLYHVDRYLLGEALVQYCETHLPQLGHCLAQLPAHVVNEAMTAKSASIAINYDRLEWIGDAVLKMVQTDALLNTPKLKTWTELLHEGDLSTLRACMAKNKFLSEACKHAGLDRFIHTTSLGRGSFVPVGLELFKTIQNSDHLVLSYQEEPGLKVCADAIESLLGLVYLNFDYATARKVALEMGVSLPVDDLAVRRRDSVFPNPSLMELVREVSGKERFEHPSLVEEALTHASAIYQRVPSYQRLAWCGDAVLCLAIREWVYHHFHEMPIGEMVTIEAALVSNEMLCYQSVSTGLHRYIRHRDQSFPSRVEDYVWRLSEDHRGVWGTDPPKILADVVGAIFGACHVDGGFAQGQTSVLTLMKPILDGIRKLEGNVSQLRHPMTVLNWLGGKFLEVSVCREDFFVRDHQTNVVAPLPRIWQGTHWCDPDPDGSDVVGTISSMGERLLSVLEPTKKSARNRVCALVVKAIEDDESLASRLLEVARIVQGAP